MGTNNTASRGAKGCVSFVAPLSGSDPKVCARCLSQHLFPIGTTNFTEDEATFVHQEALRLGFQGNWDPDFAARQIVDNAWVHQGMDLQFRQHLVEAWLQENIRFRENVR